MKKLIIFSVILFIANMVYGQAFKPVKIDSLVTVSLPAVYGTKDTLGQHLLSANTQFGYLLAIVEPNAKGNQPLKKEKDLNGVLKNYIKGIQKQTSDGSAQNIRDTTVGTLKAKAFALRTTDVNGDVQWRKFLLIYTKDATYTFEYAFSDTRKEMVKDEAKAFFSSIKLSPELQRNDQYTDLKGSSGMSSILKIAIGTAALIIIIIVIIVIRRRKRSQEE